MKTKLHLSLVFLVAVTSGCLHFSDLELRSDDSAEVFAKTPAVEKEIGDVLAASKFAPVRDKRFTEEKSTRPDFVGEWERSEYRGFWNGGEYIIVEMYARRDLIFITVRPVGSARKAVVEGIAVTLQTVIHDKFPDLKVYVRSYSYFPLWAP